MNAGSELVAAIEAVWAEVQAKHPETPDVIVVTGTGVQGRRNLHGSFWPDHWQGAGSERVHEMFLAGERFNDGVSGALSTILHEAAHGIAHARGVQDTSRQGRYHNLKFKATAEEVGLVVTQSDSHGWSNTALAIDVDEYASAAALADALKIGRRGVEAKATKKAAPPWQCECGREMRVSKKAAERRADLVRALLDRVRAGRGMKRCERCHKNHPTKRACRKSAGRHPAKPSKVRK